MNTLGISSQQPVTKSAHWLLLLEFGLVSACVGAPGDVVDTQGSSDSASEASPVTGSEQSESDSGSGSGSGSDSDSDSGSDPGPDADSGSTTGMPMPELPPASDDPNQQIPPSDEDGCHGLYAQDLFPTFDLTISDEVWDELQEEWDDGPENKKNGIDANPYHPLTEFRYGEIVITDAEIRLRGNPTWWSHDDKLQFQIGFHRNDENGLFLGLRRLGLDAATANRHMLRDRLALQIMRDMGIMAPCANNARVNINGEYYGIFSNIEKLDEIFLERVFDDPTGDLWDRHDWGLKTNENSSNDTRLLALIEADTIEELETYLDLEQALQVFAADAILPNSDGPWAGGYNFFLYDDPLRNKFVLLPWDLDNTFERFHDPPDGDYPPDPDPVVWQKPTTHGRPLYDLALSDSNWFAYYIDSIEAQLESSYDADKLHARIDLWTAQIQDAVFEDTNKPYDNDRYLEEIEDLHEAIQNRHDFLGEWLSCWQNGGSADNDGYCEEP